MERVKYNRREYRSDYLQSDEWRKLRETVMSTSPQCQCCHQTAANDVHHMVYRNIVDITVSDLLPVCRKCHKLIHQAIDDGYISQDPKVIDDIKYKTVNILNDQEYRSYHEWLCSKHYLDSDIIEKINTLQAFIIKKIGGIIKKNIWYSDLPKVKFTGRQILKIKKLIEVGSYRRAKKLENIPKRGFVMANKNKEPHLSLKDMVGFKSRRHISSD